MCVKCEEKKKKLSKITSGHFYQTNHNKSLLFLLEKVIYQFYFPVLFHRIKKINVFLFGSNG